MQDLKSILERNINLERQKLYKEQQYQAYQNQEIFTYFKNEVDSIQKIFDDQNPLYYDFMLKVEVVEGQDYQIKLCTVREYEIQPKKQEAYYYRGHLVQPANTNPQVESICLTKMEARWLPGQNQWAVVQRNGENTLEAQPLITGSRNDLLKDFLNITVKDIAK